MGYKYLANIILTISIEVYYAQLTTIILKKTETL